MEKIAECIAFANPKGGSGKTTSCLSIAGYLAKNEKRVLVVDFDPQASATSGLGIDSTSLHHSVYDAVLAHCDGYEGLSLPQVILETDIKNLHLVPSEPDLAAAEILMQQTRKRTGILKRILEDVIPLYDYILIDLPPSSGPLTINGLFASDRVVVPLEPSVFCLEALEHQEVIFNDIKRMNGRTFLQITIILTRYVKQNLYMRFFNEYSPSQEVETRLLEKFSTVYLVPDSTLIYGTQQRGVPISHYAPESKVGKAYEKIAENISNHNK